MRKKGLVHIYTGNGKGKTTAACGLAVRALSHGFRVCWVSFHKSPKQLSGELSILKKLGVQVQCFAKQHPLCPIGKNNKGVRARKSKKQLVLECARALIAVHRLMDANRTDMLILDEINICVRDGYLKESDVLKIIQEKPKNLELVLTGRGAAKKIIAQAELVSFIKEEKHPYKKGIAARKGIEY